jgi:hypothetical protein
LRNTHRGAVAAADSSLSRDPATPDHGDLDVLFPRRSALAAVKSVVALAAHAGEVRRTVSAAVRAHGGSRPAALWRLHRLRRRGFTYDEALRDGMLDPAIPSSALPGYASRHVALIAQRRVNPGTLEDLTTEKAIFYRYCAAIGLPTPRTVAIVHRDTAGWAEGDRILTDGSDFAALIHEVGADLVVKPSDGGKGVFVRVLRYEDGVLYEGDEPRPPLALWDELRSHPAHPCFIVQERLRNHPDLSRIVPSQALNTIRLVVFQPLSGPPEVSQAVIRLGLGGAVIDNFGDGSDGNGYCEIDPETGRLGPLRMAGPDGIGFVESADIPGTGARIEGVRLPMWDEAKALAFSAMPYFLPNRTIGWDVAITDDGPVIVEANREWTPFPNPNLLASIARIATR